MTVKWTADWRVLLAGLIFLLSISFSAVHWFGSYFGQPPAYVFRSTHLSIILLLVYLKELLVPRVGIRIFETFAILAACLFIVGVQGFYILADPNAIYDKPGSLTQIDVWIGSAYLFLVLDATRRAIGWALVVVASFFIVNSLIADHMFWIFYGPPVDWDYLIEVIFFTTDGLFTTPLGAMASYIVLFIIFATILIHTGSQTAFINLAMAMVGGRVSGPAKVAVVSSGMLGSISGSAVANVMTTGSITIPLMKRLGYHKNFAGAVEAAASSGGQVMPPVMGATAFIMAEFLQIPYTEIALAALVPVLLYYVSLYCMVHFEGRRRDLKPIPEDLLPRLWPSIKQAGTLLVTIGTLVAMLLSGTSIAHAGAITILVAVIASLVRKGSRITSRKFLTALNEAAAIAIPVSLACAVSGVIIGTAFTSGTATRLTTELMVLGHDQLWLILLVTMVASFVLGMGLTTSADYILLVTLAIPAIIALDVNPLAAHLFVFYFASFSGITPPVALASFAAASLSGGGLWQTGFTACKIGIAAFIVPYMLVYRPGVLLDGSAQQIVQDILISLLGVISLAASFQGWFFTRLSVVRRVILFATSLLLIGPVFGTDLIGFGLFAVIAALQIWEFRRRPLATAETAEDAGATNEQLLADLRDSSSEGVLFDRRYILSWLPVAALLVFVWWANSFAWQVRDFNMFFLSLIGLLAIIALVTFGTSLGQVSTIRLSPAQCKMDPK